tara:strand:- start:339 stop:701 length:363 start_codon:yes stop_codon:yes gene_type:complete
MIKTFIALAATTASIAAPSAIAGPYVNVETNSGFTGTDYQGSVTDIHVGYEGGDENYGFYVQGGPAVIAPEGVDGETRLSGKVGGNIVATEKLGIYGEFAVLTDDDDNSYGTKIGAKYKF